MKKLILLTSIISLFFFSCKNKEQKEEECCKKPDKKETASFDSDISLHDLSSKWTTQDNKTIELKDIKAKVIVAAMIFTNCKAACPRITADLQRIEQGIPKDKLDDVAFILITMDPERDTPKQLTSFAADHQINLKRWTLLTGSESDVLEISNVLNVRMKKEANGNFDHSNIIHIINDKGNIVYQQVGLAVEPTESLSKINAILNE